MAGTGEDVVRLEIPAEGELLILARLVTAAVASRAEFNVDEIEDLRLAVDELCLSVIGDQAGGRLDLEVVRRPREVRISCTFVPGAAGTPPPLRPGGAGEDFAPGIAAPELSSRILDALVDEHDYHEDGAQRTAWFQKRCVRSPR